MGAPGARSWEGPALAWRTSGIPQWLVGPVRAQAVAHLYVHLFTQVCAQAASWPVRTGQVVCRRTQRVPWQAHLRHRPSLQVLLSGNTFPLLPAS